MFKGIRNKNAAVNTTMLMALLLAAPIFQAHADFVSDTLESCRNQGGTVLKEPMGGRVTTVDESGGKKTEKVCYDVLCYKATGNIGEVNFNSIADFKSAIEKGDRGAAQLAYDTNVCANRTTITREEDIFSSGGSGSGSQGGGGVVVGGGMSYIIKVNGSDLPCKAGEGFDACLRRHGVNITNYTRTSGGVDSDGRTIYIVRGVSSGDVDGNRSVDVTGGGRWEIDPDCYETRFVKKKWSTKPVRGKVLKEECRGAGAGTSGGYEVVIGRDIDGGGRSRGGSGIWYIRHNGRRFACTADQDIYACSRRHGISIRDITEGCPECGTRWRSSRYRRDGDSWSSIIGASAQLVGAFAAPYFMYKGVKSQANAYLGANQTWANNCRMMQTHYVDATYSYISSNELPDRTVTPPECNGYAMGGFAGMQGWTGNGFGGFGNPWGAAGYTNGFQAGMFGPGMGYNLGMMGNSPFVNPYAGLGMQGSLNLNSLLGLPPNGISFGLGTGMGMGGMGGMGMGGMPYGGGFGMGMGGMPYGGGFGMGMGGMPYGGGFGMGMGGMPYGGGAGFGMGMNPYMGGGWSAGANGMAPWGNTGGSYWNNGGNSINGNNWFAVQNSMNANAQAATQGSMYQNMALQNQAGRANYNLGYNSYSGYSPMYAPTNMGASLGWNFSMGM